MKKCPFCSAALTDHAIKCGACGKSLFATDPSSTAPNTPVTTIRPEKWSSGVVVLRSDGTARALLDVIATAVASAGYPITQRSYSDMTLRFESGGVTWNSFAGDLTTVVVTQGPDGVRATFTSLGKPFGLTRAQRVKATKWVTPLIPGFGGLWSGLPSAMTAQESPRASSVRAAERGTSTCPTCGQPISVGGQLDHWKSHLIVAPGDGHPGGLMWRCPCKESKVYPDEGTALFDLALEMAVVHGIAPDQPMEGWLEERGATLIYEASPAAQRSVLEQESPLRRSVLEQLEAFRVATRTPIAVIALEFRALEASEEWRARETNTCPLAFFAIYDPDAGPKAVGSGAAVGKMKARADTVLLVTDDALLVAWSLPKVFGKIIHHVEVVPFDAIRAVNAVSVGVGLGLKD